MHVYINNLKLLGRHRRILEGNIRINLKEIGCKFVDAIHLSHDRDSDFWWAVVQVNAGTFPLRCRHFTVHKHSHTPFDVI